MLNVGVPFRSERAADNGFVAGEGFRAFEPADAESTLGQRFRESAERHADRVAVVDGPRRVTYRELLDRVQRIGGHLRGRLPEGGVIAILLPSGAGMVEAVLGVLAGGFAYLPVDEAAPDAEIGRLAAAAGPAAWLAAGGDLSRLATLAGDVPVLDPDAIGGGEAPEGARHGSAAGSIAAVYATSGSTGEPKLVGLPHRAVLFDIGRQTNDLFLGPGDRFDQLFSFAFSASLAPLFGSLLNGGELHLFRARGRLDELRDWLAASRITVSTMSASMLRAACDSRGAGGPPADLRLISTGGETLLAEDVERFRGAFGAAPVLQNAMASTETRTYVQYFVPRRGAVESPLPIGWAVHGKAIVLVDERGRPVAEGETGEVVVRSRYHSSGYLNDPQLTAARFEKAEGSDGEVLYRTGDFARRRADGCLVFAGRADSMVKLGGYRIELEAVAAAVRRYPGMREAVAVLREDVAGHARLAAYYVAEAEAAGLRQFLEAELVEYMVPADLVGLKELPRLASGKVDRKSLPAPRRGGPEGEARASLPACEETEAELAAIWRDLLGRAVGVDENFFESGGDSLLAVELVRRIEGAMGVRVALAALMQAPTIERLAGVIRGPRSAKMPRLAEVQPNGRRWPIFWVHGEPRLRSLARNLGFDQPLLSLQLGETDGLTSIAAMAGRHIETIRRRQPHGPYHLAGFCAAGLVAYEVAQQLTGSGEEVELLALIDTHGPVREKRRRNWKLHGMRVLRGRRWELVGERAGALRRAAARRIWSVFYRHGLPFERNMREWLRHTAPEEFLPVMAAAREYVPRPYAGRLTLFRRPEGDLDPGENGDYGWTGMAGGGLDVIVVAASHLDMPENPMVAAELRRRVAESTGASGSCGLVGRPMGVAGE